MVLNLNDIKNLNKDSNYVIVSSKVSNKNKLGILEECKKHLDLSIVEGFDAGVLYQVNPEEQSTGLFLCGGIGAPVAVINMEELISCDVKNFIVVGTAGSLQKDLNPGDLMLCNQANID